MLSSVELYAGAGGLALGVAGAGFKHKAVVEIDQHSCANIRENKRRRVRAVEGWPVVQDDVRNLKFTALGDNTDLLAAGVPCQPWSIGGKHRGFEDSRNLFPETMRAIRELRPKAILIENVKGLMRQSFADYFSYIQLMLQYPDVVRGKDEPWLAHRTRLEKFHTAGSAAGLQYRVVVELLNSADYGVPQRRERVFFVGFRSDLEIQWSFPEPTHSKHELLASQAPKGEYWERHRIPRSKRPELAALRLQMDPKIALFPKLKPWQTVRDAIGDLPKPKLARFEPEVSNHVLMPGARAYKGHTGSPLDQPAKTLKAGDHGVPGGENMLTYPDGSVRYFTIREAARIQTFPDEYCFHTSWTESMRQIGNAVPVALARKIADDIALKLNAHANRPQAASRRIQPA